MHRTFNRAAMCAFASLLMLSMACSNSSPVGPDSSGAGPSGTDAAPDGSTLKASPPDPVSPANNQILDNVRPTLVVNPSTGRFVPQSFSYEFEILSASNASVRRQTVNSTSWTVPDDLAFDTPYTWRARAVLGTAVGPWNAPSRAFRTVQFVLPGCVNGRLVDAKAYFFWLIGRTEGSSAAGWQGILAGTGIPNGHPPGVRPGNSPFYGITQQLGGGGPRARVFLPTDVPDNLGYFAQAINVVSPDGGRWIWEYFDGPAYSPRPCP